jgi:hypothetical protein
VKILKAVVFTLMLMATSTLFAQEQTNYFVGKWDLLLEGLPNDDVHIFVTISATETGLAGEMAMGEQTQKVEIEQTEENVITLKFEAQGYDISLDLKKKDENSIEGNLMGMFDVTGKRILE